MTQGPFGSFWTGSAGAPGQAGPASIACCDTAKVHCTCASDIVCGQRQDPIISRRRLQGHGVSASPCFALRGTSHVHASSWHPRAGWGSPEILRHETADQNKQLPFMPNLEGSQSRTSNKPQRWKAVWAQAHTAGTIRRHIVRVRSRLGRRVGSRILFETLWSRREKAPFACLGPARS